MAEKKPESIAGLTVGAIHQEEAKEWKAEKDARDSEKKTRDNTKFFEKQAVHMMKMDEVKQKEAFKQAAKAEAENEAIYIRRLQVMIQRYFDAFPFLREKIPKLPAKTSVGEMEEIVRLIREEMDSQRSLVQLHRYADYGFYALENFWGDGSKLTFLPPPIRFNLTHINEFHRLGYFRNELDALLMEIDIEYPWLGRQSILLRALESFSQVLIKTHIINTNPEARKVLGLESQTPKDIPIDKL
jgi:hypothetical protein